MVNNWDLVLYASWFCISTCVAKLSSFLKNLPQAAMWMSLQWAIRFRKQVSLSVVLVDFLMKLGFMDCFTEWKCLIQCRRVWLVALLRILTLIFWSLVLGPSLDVVSTRFPMLKRRESHISIKSIKMRSFHQHLDTCCHSLDDCVDAKMTH